MSTMEWDTPDEMIRRRLERGEQLLWSGRPVQGITLRAQDVFLIPFSLLWGGFAIFWEAIALSIVFVAGGDGGDGGGAPMAVAIIFPLFGLPFVLIGLYLIFGRFFVDARRRARTFYGVTDSRIIIVSGLLSQNVKSLNLRTLTDLSMSEKASGVGTITFGPVHPFAAFGGGAWCPGTAWWAPPSFDLVPNVAEVYRIIREAQKRA